jgi:hypothetical protein
MEALGGERWYSSYSFTISALHGGEWSALRRGRALPPGKGPPVPIGEEAGWAHLFTQYYVYLITHSHCVAVHVAHGHFDT